MSSAPLLIRGGNPISGTLAVNPSKNAALPILAASILCSEPVTLHGVPRLSDVEVILSIVASLGVKFAWQSEHTLTVHAPEITSVEAPYSLVSKMRASFNVLGPLLARVGEARVPQPGGCTFGVRPVDQHIKALRAMGATIVENSGDFIAVRDRPFTGRFVFDLLTVGGTQNAVCAATLGTGMVRLENCSIDTDVIDLCNFLNHLGAKISGVGTHTLEIEGVAALRGGEYKIISDRLEAGTYLLAAAATRGELTLTNANTDHLRALVAKLTESGVKILERDQNTVYLDARGASLKPVSVQVSSFPGFPTDLQPMMAAYLATVPGHSRITDPVYTTRFGYSAELNRLGAKTEVVNHSILIEGSTLYGAPVKAADIRAGAALVIAAAAAQGESRIEGVQYLNRGYERLVERFSSIGVDIVRDELSLVDAA
ncbi:MAG: UDP-N-acetylglucosamine 1-carboxyvinyltransferase [Deinococcales bacterium]